MMKIKKKLKDFFKSNEGLVLIILLIVIALFSSLNFSFLSRRNIYDLLRTMIVPGIFASGVTLVLINGGIDMSFMSIAIFSAYTTIRIAVALGGNIAFIPLLIISGFIGTLLGFCNAYIINKFKIHVYIATLSLATVIRGFMLAFIGNEYIPSPQMPPSTIAFSKMYILNTVDSTGSTYGLHISVLIMFMIMFITHLILKYTTIGRGVYALGGDGTSAKRVGFNITKLRFFIYGYAGLLAGIGGLIYVSSNRMADPMSFQGDELTVIAAIVLGGVSISGGKGSILGVFLGLLLTNTINNNLVLINVPSYWQKFVFGLLIIIAVFVQSIRMKKKEV